MTSSSDRRMEVIQHLLHVFFKVALAKKLNLLSRELRKRGELKEMFRFPQRRLYNHVSNTNDTLLCHCKEFGTLYAVHSLIKLNATVTSPLPAGTAEFTAKCYKVSPIRVKYRSTKKIN
jgi:hypothetical protein